jgi:hypothetical protein
MDLREMQDACNSGVKFRVGNGIYPVRTHAKLLSDGGCNAARVTMKLLV